MGKAIAGTAIRKLCHHGCVQRKSLMAECSRTATKTNAATAAIANPRFICGSAQNPALNRLGFWRQVILSAHRIRGDDAPPVYYLHRFGVWETATITPHAESIRTPRAARLMFEVPSNATFSCN